MTSPTALSLFAGIGGLDLAFHQAGFRVVAAVEIDVAARGVIHDRMPDTALFVDVRKVTADELRAAGFDPNTGILLAGWPCQDLSLAGFRLGLGGARSGLFWEIVRLLTDLRPRWFCLENVPGLLSAVCSCPGLIADNDATGGRLIANAITPGTHGRGTSGQPAEEGHLIVGPLQAEGADGRGHRIDAEGAANGHLIAATLTAGSASGRAPGHRREDDEHIVAAALTARQGKGVDSDAIQTLVPHVAFALRSAHYGVGQGHNTTYVPLGGEGIAHALTAEGHDASEDGTGRGTPLVPVVMPIAFDWKTDGSKRARPNISEQRTSTLATTKQDAVATTTAVRRLTPTECERLQGYPDGWTTTSWGKPQSDSARYRQLGNSVALPVFGWVARRVRSHHRVGA